MYKLNRTEQIYDFLFCFFYSKANFAHSILLVYANGSLTKTYQLPSLYSYTFITTI